MALRVRVLCLIAVTALAAAAKPKTVYRIDPDRSEFVVQLFKAGVGGALAHDHVVRATAYAGRIEADPDDPAGASISVEVQASSLRADESAVRRKYGVAGVLTEDQRRQVQTSMESKNQLDVQGHPVMRFVSTRVEPKSGGEYRVTGDLTIRGVTRSVEFPVHAERRDGAVHASGSVRFKQTDFGYQPYSAFLGAVRNRDEVVLRFDVTASPDGR